MKINQNLKMSASRLEKMKTALDEIKKNLQKTKTNNTEEDRYIDIEINDDIKSNDGDNAGPPDTRSDKEKFNAAKSCMTTMLDDYKAFQDKIWNDFPELYSTTKNLDGKFITGYISNGTKDFPVTENEEALNFSNFYSENYSAISNIAAGIETPWENVETKYDAAMLISELLDEATENSDNLHGSITSGKNINQGELVVIQTVLDELSSKNNDDINELVDMCREKLQEACNQSISVEDILSGYNDITSNSSAEIIEHISSIESDSQRIERLQTEYEEAKAQLQDKPLTEENVRHLYNIYSQYESICGSMLETGGLNRDAIFSIGSIPGNNTNISSLKSELGNILKGKDTNK